MSNNVISLVKEEELENKYEPFALSDVQLAYLMGRDEKFELGGVSSHYYIEIETKLDLMKFNNAINMLISKHPVLRSIVLPNGMQKILEYVDEYNMSVADISTLTSEEQEEHILKERNRMSHYIFKTDTWPLFEFRALKISNDKNYVFFGLDLLIADASSVYRIATELMDIYNGLETKDFQDGFSFRDFRINYNELKDTDKYKEDKQYWLDKLENFPMAPAILLDKSISSVTNPKFNRLHKKMGNGYWSKLKIKCEKYNIRPTVVFCTAYAEVLSFWSNQSKLAINLTIANRHPFHENVKNMVGDFTSVMPIDIDLQRGTSFWEKASFIQETLTECMAHNYYEGGDFIRELSKYHGLENKAVMPIVLTSMMFGDHLCKWSEIGEVKFNITQTSQAFLDNQICKENDDVTITWDYVEQLFDKDVINQMYSQYTELLLGIVDAIDYSLEINEKDNELVREYNNTDKYISKRTIHDMFVDQAMLTPNNIAIICEDKKMTYSELDEKSNQVAHYLNEMGVGHNDYVGVLAQRRMESIVNILGVLKAGAAYVPIDPNQPEERRNYILKDANCKLQLEPESYSYYNISEYSTDSVQNNVSPEEVAYVIYTSGSTGTPKGVIINHYGAINTIVDINTKFNVNGDDRILGLSSMCFDLSVYDIFGALSTGATLVMVKNQRDIKDIIRIIEEHKITIWNSVPVIMDMLLDELVLDEEDETIDYMQSLYTGNTSVSLRCNDTLRVVLLSGDWIPLNLPKKISSYFICANVISLGGATEASIWSIYYPIIEFKSEWRSIPYGIPLTNQKFYVLNYDKKICPIGVQGELYIGGIGLAMGYLNDQEKTKYSFINHDKLGRLYRTGDYGVLHKNGLIEFLGRKDQQVKIRGHRIELGEIENAIIKSKKVKNAIVIDNTDANGKRYLCAYIVSDEALNKQELIEDIKIYLPSYMIPSYFIKIDKIPLTQNGKINKKDLPQISTDVSSYECVSPRSERERIILEIWKEALEIENLGVFDDFFDVGGDSLSAMIIFSKMSDIYEIGFNSIYEYKTIAALAKHISLKEGINIENLKS